VRHGVRAARRRPVRRGVRRRRVELPHLPRRVDGAAGSSSLDRRAPARPRRHGLRELQRQHRDGLLDRARRQRARQPRAASHRRAKRVRDAGPRAECAGAPDGDGARRSAASARDVSGGTLAVSRTLALPDGRSLEVHELGDPDGFPILFHHGTPGSGTLYERWETPGVRLVGYDRAGYGSSTRNRGRVVADVVSDVHALADTLGFERFATWGLSGGGPHSLACAALCDERLVAAASLAGVGPYDAEGLDWLAGMGEGN